MLLIRTGRRMNEVLMMDFEPLLPLLAVGKQDGKEPDGFVARLAYQQTKITDGEPPTIPEDQGIVDIIRLQQKWARKFIATHGASDGAKPRYLLLQTKNNRLGRRPYASATFHSRLGALTEKLSITDSVGRTVKISKTHTFRHTRATDLINAGVPIHVVMRYLGHVTPVMTMHYAKTLAVTAEREFLRYKKVTVDGRTAQVDPSDLYDLLHLDQRADRVLPNGWCMLPPKQVCSKGNACLTCDKFVTDASHRDELGNQLAQTEVLITRRRHSSPLATANLWPRTTSGSPDVSARPALLPRSSWRSTRSVSTTTGNSVPSAVPVRPTRRNRPSRSRRNQPYEPAACHLQRATRARTERAEKSARTALAQLAKAGAPIGFTAVAREAAVSTDFLYKHPNSAA